ncbi:MAG: hypothetical protein WDN48_03410 [Pseudolabrys sp.]
MDDDYGVVEAKAAFALKDRPPSDKPPRPAVQRARLFSDLAAGAHAQRRGADHARPYRARLGPAPTSK